MWLSSSSVGRKFIMAISGCALVLFVTFHCLMNSVAIIWPAAYNAICLFLGANWYALAASAILAALVIIHIIYAVMLTLQNRKARGNQRYSISKKPATVEWSSQNMLVLGIVIVAFLVVHMIQFWAKMQLAEILGNEGTIPAAAGTLFLQEAFSQIWTPIVYLIGFVALWFHLTHGFWSMFQSVGWDNTQWIPRLRCIGNWWVTIVVLLFVAQAIVFTVRANENYYLTDPELREQYKEMIIPAVAEEVGEQGAQIAASMEAMPYDKLADAMRQSVDQINQMLGDPNIQQQIKANPEAASQVEEMKKQAHAFEKAVKLFDYLESADPKAPETQNQLPY